MTAAGNVAGSLPAGSANGCVWELSRTTTPAVPLRFIEPLAASGEMVAAVVGVVEAPPTRKVPPAGMKASGRLTLLEVDVPAAERYCTDMPAVLIGAAVGFEIST